MVHRSFVLVLLGASSVAPFGSCLPPITVEPYPAKSYIDLVDNGTGPVYHFEVLYHFPVLTVSAGTKGGWCARHQ